MFFVPAIVAGNFIAFVPKKAFAAANYVMSNDQRTITESGTNHVFTYLNDGACAYDENGIAVTKNCAGTGRVAYKGPSDALPGVTSGWWWIEVDKGLTPGNQISASSNIYKGGSLGHIYRWPPWSVSLSNGSATISIKIPDSAYVLTAPIVANHTQYTWNPLTPPTITTNDGKTFTAIKGNSNSGNGYSETEYDGPSGYKITSENKNGVYLWSLVAPGGQKTVITLLNAPAPGQGGMTAAQFAVGKNGLAGSGGNVGGSTGNDPCSSGNFISTLISTATNPLGNAMCRATYEMSSALQSFIGKVIGPTVEYVLNMPSRMMDTTTATTIYGQPTNTIQGTWQLMLKTTLSLLTLALVIIAFANILNIDEKLGYGLNRMIPKIIISIVMALFSFLLARVLLDLASALQAQLFSLSGNTSITAGTVADGSGVIGGVMKDVVQASNAPAMMLFLVIIFVMLLLAGLWLLLILIVRVAVIWILVAVAPIAMLMNILPFTESFYKKWWTEWWKWVFMGPAVALMLFFSSAILASFQNSYATGQNFEAWILLVVAAVCIFMAGTIPLTMGGKIMSSVTGAFKKGAGFAGKASGVTDRYKGFMESRSQYNKLKAQKDVSNLRNRVGKMGALGEIAAGKRGVFGKDADVAKQMYLSELKEKDVAAKEARLAELGGATADLSDPEVVALLQSISSSNHTQTLGDPTKQALAQAVAQGSGDNADPYLKAVAQNLELNPNKDAATSLYVHAQEKGYFANMSNDSKKALEQSAIRKATGKRIVDKSEDEIKAQRYATSISGSGDASIRTAARQAQLADGRYFQDPANKPYYDGNVSSKNKAAHRKYNLEFKQNAAPSSSDQNDTPADPSDNYAI